MPHASQQNVHPGPVIFFFPFRPPSGVSNVFRRMADCLADQYGLDVGVVDYIDGQIAKNLREGTRVRIIPFRDGITCPIPGDAILVMQTAIPYAVRPELQMDPETRVVLWHFLYHSLVNNLVPLGPLRTWHLRHPRFYQTAMKTLRPRLLTGLRDYVETLGAHNAILFHDRFTVSQTADFLGFRLTEPALLPVPVDLFPFPTERNEPQSPGLRFGWIGRLYDFKIHVLIHTLERLSRLAALRRLPIVFTVVGDGDFLGMLADGRFDHSFFRLEFAGVVEQSRLPEFILSRMDAVASMGTSALEAARMGIPTLLLDFAFHPILGNYRFKWLFESLPGDIGHDMLPEDFEAEPTSLESRVASLLNERLSLARKCHDYVAANHGMETIARRFRENLDAASFRFGQTPDILTRRSYLRRFVQFCRSRLRS